MASGSSAVWMHPATNAASSWPARLVSSRVPRRSDACPSGSYMLRHVNWPPEYDPRTSAIYALNEVDVKAPPEVVWKLLVDAANWSSYFRAVDLVKILGGEPE